MYEGTCYHIYNRSVGTEKLFKTNEDYNRFLTKYKTYLDIYLETYAYCLVPNHFHLLVKCKPVTDKIRRFIKHEKTIKAQAYLAGEIVYNDFIVSQFKRFFNSHAKKFNVLHSRHGTLFQRKFKRISIKNTEHFKFILLYIHHNVLHHRLGKNYDSWNYSSFTSYLNMDSSFISPQDVYKLFSSERDTDIIEFLKFHENNRAEISLYPNLKKIKEKAIDYDDI